MKKMFALFALSLSAALFAEKQSFVPFSDDVPRYTSFALGAFGVWLRVSFLAFGQRFALQSELGYDLFFHNAQRLVHRPNAFFCACIALDSAKTRYCRN